MRSKHFSNFLKVLKMATLEVGHKTFNKRTAGCKMDLSIIFVFYDTLKKSSTFPGKENYIGFEYEISDFLRPHAVPILYCNTV